LVIFIIRYSLIKQIKRRPQDKAYDATHLKVFCWNIFDRDLSDAA